MNLGFDRTHCKRDKTQKPTGPFTAGRTTRSISRNINSVPMDAGDASGVTLFVYSIGKLKLGILLNRIFMKIF